MATTTVFPFRATYKKSPRARKTVELVFFAASREAAFENLLRIVREETMEGVPGFVDALTCAEAKAAGVPFAVEGDDSGACHRCRAPLGASQYTPNGAAMPAFCSFECYMEGRGMDREGRPLSRREQGPCPHCHGTTYQGGMRSGDDCATCGGVGMIARG